MLSKTLKIGCHLPSVTVTDLTTCLTEDRMSARPRNHGHGLRDGETEGKRRERVTSARWQRKQTDRDWQPRRCPICNDPNGVVYRCPTGLNGHSVVTHRRFYRVKGNAFVPIDPDKAPEVVDSVRRRCQHKRRRVDLALKDRPPPPTEGLVLRVEASRERRRRSASSAGRHGPPEGSRLTTDEQPAQPLFRRRSPPAKRRRRRSSSPAWASHLNPPHDRREMPVEPVAAQRRGLRTVDRRHPVVTCHRSIDADRRLRAVAVRRRLRSPARLRLLPPALRTTSVRSSLTRRGRVSYGKRWRTWT